MIGVLSIQGDFAAHGRILTKLGCKWCEVRTPAELENTSGLILPGGESTTMLKFLREENFLSPLRNYTLQKKTMFGTCAGAILMAHEVTNPKQESLNILDISIERNGYGRQVNSFTTTITNKIFGKEPLEIVFIRAPIIKHVGKDVEILMTYEKEPILVNHNNLMAATFHPELTDDIRIHELFIKLTFG